MATPSYLGVTPGTGLKMATVSYTEGGYTVSDQKVILGEQYLPTFVVNAAGIVTDTSADHLVQIMAGSGLNVRIRRIAIWQSTVATTAAIADLAIVRLTSAGTGGSAITPAPLDTADTSMSSALSL